MKKALCLFIAAALLFAFSGCQEDFQNDGRIKIVASAFPGYDFARAVAGDNAQIYMLLPPGSESHSFEPTPKDIRMISDCDVFIYTGGESDEWLNSILDSVNTDDMTVISLMDVVDLLEEEDVEGMDARGEEEEETEYDEHVWTSPKNVITISEAIKDSLILRDSKNSAVYESRFASYKQELEELDEGFRNTVASANKNTLIFGDRFPLLYFAKEYGLEYYAAFPGCSAATEPSAKTVAFLIDKVKKESINTVFTIELSNGNIARTISEETGAEVKTFFTCHNVSRDDLEKGETYVSLMKKNLITLKEALD